jgi:hypothetical protein
MLAQATVFPAHRFGEQRGVSNSRLGVHHDAENRDPLAVPFRVEHHADRAIGQEFHAAQSVDIDIWNFHWLHKCSDRRFRHDKVAHDIPSPPAGSCCLFVRRQTSGLHLSRKCSMDYGPVSYNYFVSRNLQRNSAPSAPSGADSRPSRRLARSVGTFPSPSALRVPSLVSADKPIGLRPPRSSVGSLFPSPTRFTPVFASGNSGGSAAHHTRASRRLSIVVRRYVCRYVNLCGVRLSPTFGSLRQSLQKPRCGLSKRLSFLCCTVFHADQSSMEAIAACAKSSSKGCMK